jgi:site-specific DNA-methyltransferase (adenine-specific)
MTATVFEGDCLEQMQIFGENYFDSIVTDSPYGLSFMGKDWDRGVPGVHFWQECLRVAKPGAHMLAFGGTRTHHRLMVAIEDAGWEIRDCLMWVYGSGFPKSLDVSKAIDKAAGVEREVVGIKLHPTSTDRSGNKSPYQAENSHLNGNCNITAPATTAAKQWSGWGTALKPAWEPIILCRKPLDGTVANNVLKWGCGGINVGGCRVALNGDKPRVANTEESKTNTYGWAEGGGLYKSRTMPETGRYPANLIHDCSEEVLALFPQSKGQLAKVGPDNGLKPSINCYGDFGARDLCEPRGDAGSAARFFYCAKASTSERNLGCETLPYKTAGECTDRQEDTAGLNSPRAGAGRTNGSKNHHPTVKPLALLQYLCRLITPPNGIVLDPFAGSGSTGIAATREGFNSVLIEIDKDYAEIARARNFQKVDNA